MRWFGNVGMGGEAKGDKISRRNREQKTPDEPKQAIGPQGPAQEPQPVKRNQDLAKVVEQVILRDYSLPCVRVNREFNAFHFNGDTSRYLSQPTVEELETSNKELQSTNEELAEQFTRRGSFPGHFETTEEDKPLRERTEALLYRVSRELLTNISKHAEASDVFIRIDRTDGNIRIVIEDHGKRFDLAQLEEIVHQQQGFGLFSIRERLTHVGGTFALESRIGKGTKVTLIAPLHLASERR